MSRDDRMPTRRRLSFGRLRLTGFVARVFWIPAHIYFSSARKTVSWSPSIAFGSTWPCSQGARPDPELVCGL